MKALYGILFSLLIVTSAMGKEDVLLTCPFDETGDCDTDQFPTYTTLEEFFLAGGSFSGEAALLFSDDVLVDFDCMQILTRIYTIVDVDNNIYTCDQTLTATDFYEPILGCPASIQANCDISAVPAYQTYTEFTDSGGDVYEDCDLNEASFVQISEISDGSTCPETYTRVYEIADMCGNKGTCEQNVIISDMDRPEIICPDPQTISIPIEEHTSYMGALEFNADGGEFSDNCEIDYGSFTYVSQSSVLNSCPPQYIKTYEIADACYNSETCDQTILVCIPSDTVLYVSACEQFTSPYSGQTWSSTGTYIESIQNINCCDSIITIQLTIEDNLVEEANNSMPNSLSATLACASENMNIVIDSGLDTLWISEPIAIDKTIMISGNTVHPPIFEFDFLNNALLQSNFGMEIISGQKLTLENVILTKKNSNPSHSILLNNGELLIKNQVVIK